MTSSAEPMKRGSVRPGPHLTRCTAVVLAVLIFICVLLLVQFWKVSGLRDDMHESYALLKQKYQLLAKDKKEIDVKLSETKDNAEVLEKRQKDTEADVEAKTKELEEGKQLVRQLANDAESLKTNLSILRSQLTKYDEENQLLKESLNRSQAELHSINQRLAEQKQIKDRQVAVNLLAMSGNDVVFARNFGDKVIKGNFSSTTAVTTVTSVTSPTPATSLLEKLGGGGFFGNKIAAQRQLQVKLPSQINLESPSRSETGDTLPKPMFEQRKNPGGVDNGEGESDGQFIRPNKPSSPTDGGETPAKPSTSGTELNPLNNGEDKAREQLQVDNTEDQPLDNNPAESA